MIQGFTHKRVVLLIGAALVIATLVAYEPVRHNGFVSYDDDKYITENPNVTGGITIPSVIWAFTKPYASNWHPLTWLSHMLDCELYGLNPLGHHLTNVLIHIANSILLFLLLSRMTKTVWPGAFVAAVFALHPLQVDSVAWAAERKTVLSGLFWFLTIAVYIWYTKRPVTGRYILLFLVYGLCIMTKPVVVTLPFVLLLLDYWPLNRQDSKRSIPKLIIEKIPLLAMSGILSVITLTAQKQSGAIIGLEKMPIDLRLANMFVSYVKYIGKMIWPSGLAAFYPHPKINLADGTAIICAVLFIFITALAIYAGRIRKYTSMGWLWYVGTLVPVIGLVQVGVQAMANRYMYIPIAGLLIIVAWAIKEIVENRPILRVITSATAIILLSASIIVTRTQVQHWQDSRSLFGYALKVTRNNEIAEQGFGCALSKVGQFSEARLHFSNAAQISPYYADALNNLAWLLATSENASAQDANKAVGLAQRACALSGYKNAGYLDTLAAAYAAGSRFEDAVETAQRAIDIAKATGQDELTGEIQKRMDLYRAGQRYIQK